MFKHICRTAWKKVNINEEKVSDIRSCNIDFNKILIIILGIVFVFLLYHSLGEQQYNSFKPDGDKRTEIISTFKDDPKMLVDLNDFKYIINQPACEENVKALIMVHSAPNNVERRASIRSTWGNAKLLNGSPLRMLFAFGAVTNETQKNIITQENSKYHDCIQGSFIDDYRNLTYKHTMALKWHATYCDNAHFLVKVDDDTYVNTPQIIEYATKPSHSSITPRNFHKNFNASDVLFKHPRDLLLCNIFDNSLVIRDKDSKWYVSKNEYPDKYYPRYCHGLIMIYSTDVVKRLLAATLLEKYFWIDDVFITGLMAKKINATHIDIMDYFLEMKEFQNILATQGDLSEKEFLFAWHRIKDSEMRKLWETYLLQLLKKIAYNYLKLKI